MELIIGKQLIKKQIPYLDEILIDVFHLVFQILLTMLKKTRMIDNEGGLTVNSPKMESSSSNSK